MDSVKESKILYEGDNEIYTVPPLWHIDYDINDNFLVYKDEKYNYYKMLTLIKMDNTSKIINKTVNIKDINTFAYDWIYDNLYFAIDSNIFISQLKNPYFIYLIDTQ